MQKSSDFSKRVILNILIFGGALLIVFLLGKFREGKGLLHLLRGDYSSAPVMGEDEVNTEVALTTRDVPNLVRQNGELIKIVDLVSPSVVSITTKIIQSAAKPKDLEQGSGVIVTDSGHVVTAYHVVSTRVVGQPIYSVEMDDGTLFEADLVGTDAELDLALLKIRSEESFRPIAFGDSDQVLAGQKVFAFGNPFGLGGVSFSEGNVAAKYRFLNEMHYDSLQITASLNPGQSGGPLVNIFGELIGLNSSIYSRNKEVSGFQGIAFAVRSNDVKSSVLSMLKRERPERGYLGLDFKNLNDYVRKRLSYPRNNGVWVSRVNNGSPADKAGIKVNDIIISFDERAIVKAHHMKSLVRRSPNKKAYIDLWSEGERKRVQVNLLELGKVKDAIFAKMSDEKLKNLFLGIGIKPEDFVREDLGGAKSIGVRVKELVPNSLATKTKLRVGDMILSVNGKEVRDSRTFLNSLRDSVPFGETVIWVRRSEASFFWLVLEQMPMN